MASKIISFICHIFGFIFFPLTFLLELRFPRIGNGRLKRFYKGKRVVVTGAASGIGKAMSLRLHDLGARVLAVDINKEGIETLIKSKPGIEGLAGDLLKEGISGWVVQRAEEKFKGVDILFNNAGIFVLGPFQQHDEDQIRGLCRVNLEAPMLLAKAVLPIMTAQPNGGSVVFTGSVASYSAVPAISPYAATKAGIRHFARALKRELFFSKIHIGTLYPLITRTNLAPVQEFDNSPSLISYTAEEVAEAALWGALEKQTDIFVGPLDHVCALLDLIFPSLGDFFFISVPQIREALSRKFTVGYKVQPRPKWE